MSRKTRRNESRTATTTIHLAAGRPALPVIRISGLALGTIALSSSVFAADAAPAAASNDNADLQEVVVTGIRASLQRAADIKQQSVGVVDAISAEDIGAFPDASIGEAVARIPGVTVNRGSVGLQTAAGPATSTGSVSGVTVRGFGAQFNESLLNGRPIASGLGQNFDFSALGSQWVSEVDVLKTPDFSLTSGDVGATINIKLPNPLDHRGLDVRMYASATDYENNGAVRPAGGFLVSNTFADDTFGVLLDADYSDHRITTDHQDIVGWKGNFLNCGQYATMPAGCTSPTQKSPLPSWTMQDMAIYLERADERRKDGRVAVQWRPTDSVLITLDDNYSSFDQKFDRWQFSTWFGGNFENMVTDGNGTVTNFVQDSQQPFDFNAVVDDTYLVTNTPGINVKWDVTDHLTMEVDGDQSESKLNPNHTFTHIDMDVGYGPSVKTGTNGYIGGMITPGANQVPYWTAIGPNSNYATNPRAANFFGLTPDIIGSHVFPIQENIAADRTNQFKVDTTWHTDDTKVKAGFQWVDDVYETSGYDTFYNNYWQLWSGYGPASNNPTGVPLPANLFTPVNLPNFIPGFSGNGNLPPGVLLYNPYAVGNYLANQPINAGFASSNGTPAYTPGTFPQPAFNPGALTRTERNNYSPFITGEHDFQLGGDMKLKADVGLRYQRTNVKVAGNSQPLLSITNVTGDHTAYQFNVNPVPVYTQVTNTYSYFLPSLDLNLSVRPDLKVRFDASRTETAAPDGLLTPNTTYGGRVNALVGTGHNSFLKPYLADSFDLGAEWYYSRNSYVSIDTYLKRVTQFPVQGTIQQTLPGIIDPSPDSLNFNKPAVFSVTTTVNGQSADVNGVEFTWQQILPLGFGFQINGTYVHTNKPFNPYNLEGNTNTTQFALPGIGNSANFIGFYENYGFHARLTVQWQAEQFLAFGQEQNLSSFGTEPTFLAATTQVDFSSSYDINNHLSVFMEALNLNDSEYHTRGRFSNQLLNVSDYGRSYTVGVRAKL
jgi:iron complex outermembrane recepter protein